MTFTVLIQPRNISLEVEEHQTILDAARSQGFRFPYGCDAGTCYVCSGILESGSIRCSIDDAIIHSEDTEAKDTLFCLAQPISDCTITIKGVLAPGEYPMTNAACQVTETKPLDNDMLEVTLRLPAGKKIDFHPGQYLQIVLDDKTRCSFSIGSIPNGDRLLQLYVLFSDKDNTSKRLRTSFSVGNVVQVSLPHGKCYLENPGSLAPLYLVAGSTGISQIKSIAEQCIASNTDRSIYIYWGTRSASELFLNDYFCQMAKDHHNIQYTPVVSEDEEHWQGRTGFVHKAMLDDANDLSAAEIILCGSPGMVYAVFDDFLAQGIMEEQVQSDVFEYAPRAKD